MGARGVDAAHQRSRTVHGHTAGLHLLRGVLDLAARPPVPVRRGPAHAAPGRRPVSGDIYDGYECRCFLGFEPPDGVKRWRPDLGDDDPGSAVPAFVRYGDDPNLRRAVRRRDGLGFDERGAGGEFHVDRSAPLYWGQIGMCWGRKAHPGLAAHSLPVGAWVAEG